MPADLRRHNISDEELEMLKTANRDGLSEAFWGFTGAGAAALPSALESLYAAYVHEPANPLSGLHLCELMIVIACAVAAVVIKIIASRKSKSATNLVDEIRNRPVQ